MDPTKFKYGDKVEARTYGGDGGEWYHFYFIAYVPELIEAPFIVKGDLNPGSCSYPLRAHRECRRREA